MRGEGGESLGETLIALAVVFVPLSLLSFGGSNAVLADIAHQSIIVHGWTSEREFADFFALSRAAPGPGSMLAALIGWKAAGIAGALVATLAFYLPSALLVFGAARHCAGRGRAVPGERNGRIARLARRAGGMGRGDRHDGGAVALAGDASGAVAACRRGVVRHPRRGVAAASR